MVYGQSDGQRSFEFMNIPSSAKLMGLGGVNISQANEDLNLAYSNPALTSDTLSGMVSFNYLSYFANVGVASFIYQHSLGKYGPWHIGVHHVDYGEIDGYDDTGGDLGEFQAGETVVFLGKSHQVRHFTVGANLKFAYSGIAGYSSSALLMDLGGIFQHPNINFSAGLAIKNLGVILSDYSETSDSSLPFDVQVGMTFKPEHMPFRFSFTGHHLHQGDISYYDAGQSSGQEEPGKFDKIFRHIVVGAELLLTKNVNLRFGYNHLVRQELKLEEAAGGAGFSYGLMFRVKAFEFAYSRGGYHVAGGAHSFTLTANTNMFFRKGKV
ncbi:hypothetical protein C900_01123 [Fulvivirga imtechensis AK7]|uniref:Low affinity penicillin binding protein n=2 Tax=Fulvivirga TaxID=396811 RepID=L8JYP4_9BACT|nr:hypothetical protein C900_01123 [Fulvivirga imtechensis AK7]